MKLARLGPRDAEMPTGAVDDATYDPHAGDVVELDVEGMGRRRHKTVAA